MGAVIDGKAEKPTLELLDDMVDQTLRSLLLGVATDGGGKRPAELSREEADTLLEPHARRLSHYRAILRDVIRQAAALGENAVLQEMDKLGVERDLLAVAADRRRP